MQCNTVCEIEIHEHSQRFSWDGAVIGWEKRWHHCCLAKRQKVLRRRIFLQNLFIAAFNMQQLDSYHLTRERMECWAALSYCKRDVQRGPINPRLVEW